MIYLTDFPLGNVEQIALPDSLMFELEPHWGVVTAAMKAGIAIQRLEDLKAMNVVITHLEAALPSYLTESLMTMGKRLILKDLRENFERLALEARKL